MMDILLLIDEIENAQGGTNLEFKMKNGSEDVLKQCLFDVSKQNSTVKDIIIDVAAKLYCDSQKNMGNIASA